MTNSRPANGKRPVFTFWTLTVPSVRCAAVHAGLTSTALIDEIARSWADANIRGNPQILRSRRKNSTGVSRVRRLILELQVQVLLALCLAMLALAGCSGLTGAKSGTTPPTSGMATITVQPVSQAVTMGQSATFAVTAGGAAPLTYQWSKNATPIPGATSASFKTPATTSSDNGSLFNVVVSNSLGSVTSGVASLSVTSASSAPTISAQPASQTVTAGQTATFSVAATGTAPLTYQWQKNSTSVAGATSATYITPATTSADNSEQYRVVIANASGSATSNAATLTVLSSASAPEITAQPASQTVTAGQTATFRVTATGTAPLTYQWQKNSASVAGATSATYTTPATTSADNSERYRVVITNSSGSATSNAATLTVTSSASEPSITVQPANETVTAGHTATFSVTATGTAPLSYQWKKNGSSIAGATLQGYTTPVTATSDSGATFDVVVSNSVASVTSNMATLTVKGASTPPPPSAVDVVTYHYDNLRTGQNIRETTLTTANVNSSKFGRLGSFSVDGKVDGQPLYLSNLSIPGKGTKNVLYVVTEHDSIYAFDADSVSGSTSAFLWKVSALQSGESSSDDRGCGQITPEIGITSTPVIDRTRNAIYIVSVSKDGDGNYFHRIHALNLATGSELLGGPTTIAASYPGSGANSSNGNVIFDPRAYNERAGLLQIGGTIYTSWGSHCDGGSYTSWVMSYNADTLKQSSVINLVPNGSEGGIWMSGAAPAADASGNIYLIVGNGDFDTTLNGSGFPANANCGNCYAKISSTAPLKLLDYFTPQNTVSESSSDTDFGSGGPLLLPDVTDAHGNTRHIAVGSGKDANIYVVDRDNMGKFNSGSDNIYQQLNGQLGGGMWAKPSYFNGTVYYGAVNDVVKAFQLTSGKLSTSPTSQGSHQFGYPGTTPSISANGTSNGIVWAVENSSPAVLHGYDASNVGTELYNSNQASNGRDHFTGNKYITPVVVNGKVYVATPNSVAVFGLLP
jgi:Immunoglobulin domain